MARTDAIKKQTKQNKMLYFQEFHSHFLSEGNHSSFIFFILLWIQADYVLVRDL